MSIMQEVKEGRTQEEQAAIDWIYENTRAGELGTETVSTLIHGFMMGAASRHPDWTYLQVLVHTHEQLREVCESVKSAAAEGKLARG